MNCSSGIRCPEALTDSRATGVALKKVLIREMACRLVVWSSRVRALAEAPVVPLSWPDWARLLRRLTRLRGPEPKRAFWIAGTSRAAACGRRAAWVESRKAVASRAPAMLALKSAICCGVGVAPLAKSCPTWAWMAAWRSRVAARTCCRYAAWIRATVRGIVVLASNALASRGLIGGAAGAGVSPDGAMLVG